MTSTVHLDLLASVRALAKSGEARRRREAAGFSLSEIGAVCRVDQSTIWRWETGRRKPRGDAALRYARVLERLAGGEA
jgi:transcriptional regulator with XRE-family HTH domain